MPGWAESVQDLEKIATFTCPTNAIPNDHDMARRHPFCTGRIVFAALLVAPVAAMPQTLKEKPLIRASHTEGPTQFTQLPAAQSGVELVNRYTDPQMWSAKYQEFSVGAIGTGVAIGDIDGDGLPDVFLTSKTEACKLFKNLGALTFRDVTTSSGAIVSTGAWVQGATFVDVDNDGDLDLYVCRFSAPNLLFINRGDGTFVEEAATRGLAVVDACGMAAFADYDRDGWLDVYIQTNLLDAAKSPNGQRDYLYRNRGDGSFENVTDRANLPNVSQGHSVVWWDFDEDGWPDLYVANDFGEPDWLLKNQRNGTFTNVAAAQLPHVPYSAMGSDAGDINDDGHIDLLVADMPGSTHERDQLGSADSRTRNRDPQKQPAPYQFQRNALFLGGTQPLREAANLAGLPATDWTWSVLLADLDNDGRLDAFFTNGMVRQLDHVDLVSRMMSAESADQRIGVMKGSPVHALENVAFRNAGDLEFTPVGKQWGLDYKGVSFGAAFADLDRDGDLDLVVSNYQENAHVYRNDGESGGRVLVSLRSTSSNRFGLGSRVVAHVGDRALVRELHVSHGYLSSTEPVLHFGLGHSAKIDQLEIFWPDGRHQITGPLAAGHHYTVQEDASSPATDRPSGDHAQPSLFRPIEVHSLDDIVDFNAAEETQLLCPWRFNRDVPSLSGPFAISPQERLFVLGGSGPRPAQIWTVSDSSPNGRFERLASRSEPLLPDGPCAIVPMEQDRWALIVTKTGAGFPADADEYQPELWLRERSGAWTRAAAGTFPSFHTSAGAACVGDFDGDHRLDVFIGSRLQPGRYPLPGQSGLFLNRGDHFEAAPTAATTALQGLGMITAAKAADLDADGWTDLVIATDWGPVKYLHNQGGHGFEDRTEAVGFSKVGNGWWRSLGIADFNRDGIPDVVVGNVGLNTMFHASKSEPALLYYGKLREGGRPAILEAQFENGKQFPRRTRRQFSAAIPAITKKFPANEAFARATVEEIVPADLLAKLTRFEAQEFRSALFLSQGAQSYSFVPLPRTAQLAPCTAIATGDFDGDGDVDLALGQNSAAADPYYGKFDGGVGQVLLNDGGGTFIAVEPSRSGFTFKGNTTGIVILDTAGGAPDLLVAGSESPLTRFVNRTKKP
jgi:enediyne biosynthesis protein E4